MQCHLWHDPATALAQPFGETFEMVTLLHDSSHEGRGVVACRDCGQRYMWDWHEEIDWDQGNDPVWVTFVPIRGQRDVDAMRDAPTGLAGFLPRLHDDRQAPSRQTPGWIRAVPEAPT